MASQAYNGEDSQWRGWAAHDRRFVPENEDGATIDYTQAGPRAGGVAVPGDDRSAGVLATSGDQDQTLQLSVWRGGLPQAPGGVEVGYRTSGEPATSLRGWELPNVIRGSYPIRYGTYAYSQPALLALRDGRLWAALESDELGASSLEFEWLRPDEATTWTSGDNIPAVKCNGPVALAQDSAGRLLCLFRDATTIAGVSEWQLWRTSLPDLATGYAWQKISSQPFGANTPSTQATRLRLFVLPNGDLCLIAIRPTAPGSVEQFASSDGGRSFVRVLSLTNNTTNQSEAWQLPSGAVAVAVVDAANTVKYYTTSNAWKAFNAQTGIQLTTGAACIWGATDPVGRLYVWVRLTTNQDRIYLYSSDDLGTTWTLYDHTLHSFNGDTAEQLSGGQAAHLGGAMYLACQSVDSVGAGDASPMVYQAGGFSSMSLLGNASVWGLEYTRLGSGAYYPTADWLNSNWLPVTEATNVSAWTPVGVGTGALVTPGVEEITTAANTRYFQTATALTVTQDTAIGEFQFMLASGGGSTVSPNVAVISRLSNGATGSELRIQLAAGGLWVRNSTSTLVSAAINVTTQPVQIRWVHIRESRIEVYYKRPTETAWTLLYSGTPVSIAVATQYLYWGNIQASTTVSRWWYFWSKIAASGTTSTIPLYGASASALSNTSKQIGRVVSSLPAALPTLAAATAGQGLRQTYLRALDGPFAGGETFTSSPAYDYPIEAIYPTIQPSPRRVWRSVDTYREQLIAWDFGSLGLQPRAVALAMFGANFQTAELESWNATSGAWVSQGTWDASADFKGLGYDRADGVLTIKANATIARYIWRNELVGASIDLGGGLWRRIVRHTEGIWSTAAGKHVSIEVEGWDAGDPASGTADIACQNAVLIIPDATLIDQKWRIRIPIQGTADGYFQIGTFVLGGLLIPGATHGWGTTTTYDRNAEDFLSADLVSRAQRRGPVARTWSWAWPDGIDLSRLYDSPPTPDYLTAGSSEGVANVNDAPYFLAGMLEELRSGEIPVCAMEYSGSKAATITDPSLFMLARITSSVGLEHIQGRPEADAVYRISPLTMREIV